MKIISEGIILCDISCCGTWLLYCGNEGMILEMPPKIVSKNYDYSIPAESVKKIARELNIAIKYLTISHNHWDHIDGWMDYLNRFESAIFIAHKAQLTREFNPRFPNKVIFQENEYMANLNGEPVHFIYAPKHSTSDVLIVFRGAQFTGDWWLGPEDPNPNKLPFHIVKDSIERVLSFPKRKNYRIHTLIAVHANDTRYNIDYENIMRLTLPNNSN